MQIILTHENADFDAVASLLGAHKLYPGAKPVLPHRVNRNVQAFLSLYRPELPFVDSAALPRGDHVRRVILVDTQSLTSVRGMGREIQQVEVIDHHARREDLPPHWSFRGELLGATVTLLVEALSARLIPVNRVEATLMLAGIYEDTGSLTYASTTTRDLRAAAWLLDHDASLEIVNDFLHHPLSDAQRALYDALLEHSETHQLEGHNVVISWAEAESGLDEEISTLAHKLRDLMEPSALFILVGLGESTQLVARSTTDDINVAEVARYFGGDGHDRAAAALMRGREPAAVFAELRELLPRFVRPALTVRALMSYSVRTVSPETKVREVEERMVHTGHEGFPVVEEGRVVGLVTRNAVDRALQHRWEQQPVHRIMEPGEVVVSPRDSIERVRDLMIQRGWGQIPVVEGGELIGVVTRTDLIRLPATERERERQQIALLIEQAFPAPLLALIRQIGEEAAARSDHLYFVGGIVRDLLLGQPISDVDLVVEGDAISLGRALTRTYGGELRTHHRFGTAKWLLTEESWRRAVPELTEAALEELLPDYIDFVTARTEFYSRPTALPTVERSSIKQDLHRRDFTINTLAIRLSPGHWGELLDFFGGREDLERGILRVLHSLSFIDDPTRILRAARFEARLGFRLDPRSEALIADALPLLDRVTGSRIRHELELIFRETRPEAALERLQELGSLQQIDPLLKADADTRHRFERLRAELDPAFWKLDEDDLVALYWSLFLHRHDLPTLQRVADRLMMPRRLFEALYQLPALHRILQALTEALRPSEIVALLEGLPSPLLAAAWIIADDPEVRTRIRTYWERWRHVQPEVTGGDLKVLGLDPGPSYRRILDRLREARLDGEVANRTEELALAQKLAQEEV